MNTNIALIGAGRIGIVHAETIAQRIPGAHLFAIADPDITAARRLGGRLAVPHVFDDAGALWDRDDVDAVVIASATNTHADYIIAAAAAGKDIFCEKPIASDIDEIDRALAAVDDAGVILQVGFNRRFDPNFAHIKRLIDEGKIGEPHLLRITSRDPAPPPIEYVRTSGGLFFDMAIHDFDMARFLIGDITRVYAVGGCRVDPAIGEAGDVDTAIVTLEFENGVFGTIDNSRRAAYGYDQRVEVFGSEGVAIAENETPHRTSIADASGVRSPLPLHFFMQRYTAAYQAELEAFVACVQSGGPSPVSGIDGRAPVLIAMAAAQSLRERRPVDVRR